MNEDYEIIIIGSGPAGLTAGLYAGRSKLRTLIIEKESLGGQLSSRDLIENYPGYPEGIMGPELSSRMMNQVLNYGVEIQLDEVEKIKIDGSRKVITTAATEYSAPVIIIAAGAKYKDLDVPGEQEFIGQGVFYCATCDGPRFANKIVAVAGGGDSGITEGLFLANLADKVVIIEALPQCTATQILQERAFSHPKIEIKCGTRVAAIRGDTQVTALELAEIGTGQRINLPVDGLFVHIGVQPDTDYLRGTLPLTEDGFIIVNEELETEVPGIFAAGDIRRHSPMQIASAVGDGATAGMSAIKFLTSYRDIQGK